MIVCNPLNLSYRYQLPDYADVSRREGADPSIVFYGDEYWLFVSKSGGYWHSPDLCEWTFVPSNALPVEDYAPDAAVIDGHIYVTASRRGEPCPIYRSQDPAADAWEKVCDCPEHNDPALFQDEDGAVYRYRGCSNSEPLYGCKMDRETMLPGGPGVELYAGDRSVHGWERRGEDHGVEDKAPHIEGAWMTGHGGRYYLEYASPGTQYNVYSDAVLVSESPLGPFRLQAHNPHSYRPGGFLPGAGHGSTFRDRHGNWWHTSTMRISVRHKFERRIGLWPAGFDQDGVMFCNTSYGDWPMHVPKGPWDPFQDAFAGQMLLSYRARADAASALSGHPPEHAFDEDVQTDWVAESAGADAVLTADLGEVCTVQSVQTNFADHDADRYGREGEGLFYRYAIEGSADGESWKTLVDKRAAQDDLPHDFVLLEEPAAVRYVRLEVLHVPGGRPALSGLRVFGRAPGDGPEVARQVRAERADGDRRNAAVRWQAPDDVVGAVVRWGVSPEKLYSSCMVYGAESLDLRCLSTAQDYCFAVELFNRAGVGPLSRAVGPV